MKSNSVVLFMSDTMEVKLALAKNEGRNVFKITIYAYLASMARVKHELTESSGIVPTYSYS